MSHEKPDPWGILPDIVLLLFARINYQKLFNHHLNDDYLKKIRTATNKGMVVGNDRFRDEIEALTGRRVREKKRGRPIGWRKSRN